MPPAELRIELPERYHVVRHVASGGMAAVWIAEDSILGRLVAVKVLASHVAADPSARTRFEREARTAARVSDHPNVATIYDVGEHDGVPFIVMELFTGGSVADRLRTANGPLARSLVLAWLEQAAAALDYAHAEGIVHRDVKPGNLLLDERDRLAVGDFGIARIADDTNLTQAGQVLGTAAYLSPEQALGDPATAASDRYALGVVAYELLAGRRPFVGDHIAAQARQHVEDDVPEAGLGPDVDEVFSRAMAKEPDARYPTAARFVEELRAAATRTSPPPETAPTRPVAAVPVPTPTPSPHPPPDGLPPRHDGRGGGPRAWLVVAAVAAVTLGVALLALAAGGGDEASTQRAAKPTTTEQRDQPQARTTETTPPAAAEQPQTQSAEDQAGSAGPDSETAESPAQLNDEGYRLLQSGQAEQAVPLLERSVQGFDAQGPGADAQTFGYALYNLGTAYVQTGRPADAIPMFERRLEVSPDDRPGVVRKALKDARKAAGQKGNGKQKGASYRGEDWDDWDDE